MLPTSRMTIYFAKATTILMMVLSLLAFQLILLPIEIKVFQQIVPSELLGKMSTIDLFMSPTIFTMILPSNFMDFIFRYLIGMGLVFTLFTFILLERSYRWKGIIFGIIYVVAIAGLLLIPAFIQSYLFGDDFSFYPSEVFYMELGLFTIIITGSILFSKYLLKNKVSV
jgi:hypothetical protein